MFMKDWMDYLGKLGESQSSLEEQQLLLLALVKYKDL
jgi:hypothetical protein